MKSINKTGQMTISGMPGIVIAIGVTVIVLVISLIIAQEMRDMDMVAIAGTTTIANETLTTVEDVTGESIAGNAAPNCQLTVGTITNATGTETLTSGNYTVSGCTIKSTSTSLGWNNTDWNVSGSYTQGGEAYTSTNESIIGLGTFGDFVSIIVLAIIAAIVLGIIFSVFGRKAMR